ncbi:hypothetical protein EV714DRAFT_287050 [Schizophyllum commune]
MVSSAGPTGLHGSRSGSTGPASPAIPGPAGSDSPRAAEFAVPAAVTEDRRRGIFARLLGRSRTPPVRFFTIHDRVRTTPPLRHAASILHLNRAYREHALGNADENGSPRHDVDDERSHGPTCADAQTSPVPTVLTYPSPDHISVNGSASLGVTMDPNIPTIPSEGSGGSPRNRSAFDGRATPIPSAFYSPFRGTGLSRPSESPIGRPAGLLLATSDPGPSTLGLGRARADNLQPSNAPTDHRNASGAEMGVDTSSHVAAASGPLSADANNAIPNIDGTRTYLSVQHFTIKEGLFVDRKMLIRTGSRTQLNDVSARPFSEGLRALLYVCENHRSDLDQLDLEFFEAFVQGGASDGRDALLTVLLVHAVSVSDDIHSIIGAFSRLRFLRLAGHTTVARIHAFPLRKLRVTERDVRMLPMYWPIMRNTGQGCLDERSDPSVCYPSVMRIISAFPCEELLAARAQKHAFYVAMRNSHMRHVEAVDFRRREGSEEGCPVDHPA